MAPLHMDKLEAIGNDFLVALDESGTEFDGALARQLCDRRRGVGADGLIRLRRSAALFEMSLWNADGTPAETSGNGLRCAALAARRAGWFADEVVIHTDAGPARCSVVAPGPPVEIRTEMGIAHVDEVPSPLGSGRAFRVDVGNPHLVLIDVEGEPAISAIGPELSDAVPGGQNVELVRRCGPARLSLEVYERGVGVTEACGSGSVAAAAAASTSGLASRTVTVENPGGDLVVEVGGGSRPSVALTGPARHVASVVVETDELEKARP